MKRRIMLDIETMGNRPGAVIVAIAGVEFDDRGLTGDECYVRIEWWESGEQFGLRCDASTVKWWLEQSEEARREVMEPGLILPQGLRKFAKWVLKGGAEEVDNVEVWGNSPSFDCVLLAEAFREVGLEVPWSFRGERCYRTLREVLPEVPMEWEGTAHHALHDARNQARHLVKLLSMVREQKEAKEAKEAGQDAGRERADSEVCWARRLHERAAELEAEAVAMMGEWRLHEAHGQMDIARALRIAANYTGGVAAA